MTLPREHRRLDPEEDEARDILARVTDALSQLLHRPSRWAGTVELTDSLFSSGVAHIDGRIEITRAVWRQPEYRWRTVIHEALHLFSPPYTKHEYSLARGWEEGVVEQTQRLLRQDVLTRLDIVQPEEAFAERDARHEYNSYILALESLRQPLGQDARAFYLWLLAIPLPDRPTAIRERGDAIPDPGRVRFRQTLLLAQARLGRP